MKAFVSVFVAAIFVMLGMANAASLGFVSNAITTPIDLGQNAIYRLNEISGGVAPYIFNAYFTNANTPATNMFIGSNTFAPSATSNVITLEISNATSLLPTPWLSQLTMACQALAISYLQAPLQLPVVALLSRPLPMHIFAYELCLIGGENGNE
jgi:hypothetical protein